MRWDGAVGNKNRTVSVGRKPDGILYFLRVLVPADHGNDA